MRFNQKAFLVVFAVAACLTVFVQAVFAGPAPRSERTATHLKDDPPPTYIRHYLGDDRYLINSGIWKVVSTQTDHYYHKPNCPNMLRQNPDLTIGFASAKDAEEAGYAPDPFCDPHEKTALELAILKLFGAFFNLTDKPKIITLSDGVSTVALPPHWGRSVKKSILPRGEISSDTLESMTSGKKVVINIANVPGMDMRSYLSAQNASRAKRDYENFRPTLESPVFNPGARNITQKVTGMFNYSLRSARLGGISGIEASPSSHRRLSGGEYRYIAAGRGSKAYQIVDYAGDRDARSIIASFHAR